MIRLVFGSAHAGLTLIVAVSMASAVASAETPQPSSGVEPSAGASTPATPDEGSAADVAASTAGEGAEAPAPQGPADDPARELEGEPPPESPVEESPGEKREGIEEIVVTGETLENSLQNEPVAATTFGGDELKSLRVQNIQDLSDYTPNLEINTAFAASNPTLFIRGIGLKDYNANAPGAVAVYQDGVNINSPAIQLGQLFDVGSVEILRGPQGIEGRNATGGAIRINSVLPEYEFDFNGSFTYGNYNTIQAEGAMTLPLIDDVLSARMAFTANFRDGITENACADWNPEAQSEFQPTTLPNGAINSFLVNRNTLGDEFEKDRIAGRAFNTNFYEIDQTRSNVGFNGTRKQAIDAAASEISAAGLDPVVKRLAVDQVCLVESPGGIVTPLGEQNGKGMVGEYVPNRTPQFEDFQGLKRYINDVNNWAARGILRLTPPAGIRFLGDTDWLLNLHGGQNKSDSRHQQMLGATAKEQGGFFEALQNGWSERSAAETTNLRIEGIREVDGLDPSPTGTFRGEGASDPFVGWYDQDGQELLDTFGANLKGTWEARNGTVATSLTSVDGYDRLVEDEGDATPLIVFPAIYDDSAFQITQEFRAEFEHDRFRWFAGLFFLYEKLDSFTTFPDVIQFTIEQTFDQTLLSGAPYVGGAYDLTEEVSIEGGLRYNVEHKNFGLGTVAQPTRPDATATEPIPFSEVEDTWTGLTGGLTLVYAPEWGWLDTIRSDELSMYAKYSRGMKGGHFNASVTIADPEAGGTNEANADILPVEPEFIHAVEAGIKSTWFDNRLTFNVAGFHYWYQDYQVFDIQNGAGELPLPRLLNADATVLGAEVEFEARPVPELFLQGAFGYLDSEFVDFAVVKTVSTRRNPREPQLFVYDGNPLIASPKFSFSGIAEYTLPLSRWGFLIPQYTFSFRSKQYLDPQALDPISQDPYWLHNARLTYRTPNERIEVSAWVQNFLDEHYKIDVFDLSRSFNSITEVWGDPRTFGVTVSYAW
jgi:outer membrane receptor protein involved in Fe transport